MTHYEQLTYDGDRIVWTCSCGYWRTLDRHAIAALPAGAGEGG